MLARADEFESALFAIVLITIVVGYVWWMLRRPANDWINGRRIEPCGLTVTQFQVVKDAIRDVAIHALICYSGNASQQAYDALYQSINDLCVLCDVDPGRLINGS